MSPWKYNLYKRKGEEARETRQDRDTAIQQNLEDAGCDCALLGQCMQLIKNGRRAEALRLLAAHRSALLEAMHSSQDRLDCLDYLIYKIKNDEK